MNGHPYVVITYKSGERNRDLILGLLDGMNVYFLTALSRVDRKQALEKADVLLSWNLAKELEHDEFSLLAKVRLIQLVSAGADHLPYRELPESVVIASNVGAYAEPMAEHVLAMALAFTKNLFTEHRKMARGEFNQSSLNRLLRGSICGIIGFGGIGRAAAHLMLSLGVRIYAINTSGRTDERVDFIGTMKDLGKVLPEADAVVLSLPLTNATRGLIGKRELELMKPDAILINVARGDIIQEGALYTHLAAHPEFKAGIDTWWHEPSINGAFRTNYPFFSLPNLVGSPHNSGMVPGMEQEGTRRAVENIIRFLKGETPSGIVRREDYL